MQIEYYVRRQLHGFLRDWLVDKLPQPQSKNTVRIAVGNDTAVIDKNLADFYRGDKFAQVLAVRFNKTIMVNAEALPGFNQVPSESGFSLYLRDDDNMALLSASITALRSNPTKASVKRLREGLGKMAHLFPEPHPTNKLITKFRVRNALHHEGRYRAVTYKQIDGDEVFGTEYHASLDDAVLARLSDSTIANVLEL